MTTDAGSVVVGVEADAKDFDRDLDRKVRDSLRGAEKRAAEGGKRFGQALGSTAGRAVGTAAKAAGVAAGALLTKGLFDALGQARDQSRLTAQLGLDPTRAGVLGKQTGAIYANNFGTSLGEVNEAARLVIQNLNARIGGADLTPLTEGVLSLSQAFGQDLPRVTAAAANLIRNGLAKDAKQALDIVTAGFQQGVDKSEDYLDTLNEYGPQFRKLGLDGNQATALLVQGLRAGARDADTVADSLKELSIRAVDGSKTSAEGYKILGLNAKNTTAEFAKGGESARKATALILDRLRKVSDPVKREAAGVALLGTKYEDMGPTAVAALDPVAASLGTVTGKTKALGDALANDAGSRLDAFTRKLETGIVRVLANDVIPKVEAFAGVLQRNGDVIVPVVSGLATFAATLYTVNKAIAATNAVMAIFGATTTIALGPIGLIVIGLVALGVGLVVAYKKSETFRLGVNKVFKAVGGVALTVIDGMLAGLETLARAAGKLPGPLGAPFRAAEKDIKKARENVAGMQAQLDRLPTEKSIKLVLTASETEAASRAIAALDARGGAAVGAAQRRRRGLPPAKPEGKAATGAIVRRPTVALVGEAGPEAIIPLSRTRGNGPLPDGQLGGSQVVQNFYVTERQDADAMQRQAAFRFRVAAGS